MNNYHCCDSRKHLIDLASELFKGKDSNDTKRLSNEMIAEDGIREIIQMRKTYQLAKQTLRFLSQVRSKNTKDDIQYAQVFLNESPFKQTIKEIANYKITIIRQAQTFEEIIKNKEVNLNTKFAGMVAQIFRIVKKDIKDLKPIINMSPIFFSVLKSMSFFDALKQKSQAVKIEELGSENQGLNKTLEELRERLKKIEEENSILRASINKKQSKQMILDDQNFQQDFEIQDISKKKLPAGYTIKVQEQMTFMNISSKKKLQSIACSAIVPFQEKTFVDQQAVTISQEFFDSQSQTDDFALLIAQYIRPLEEALVQKQQQALQWKRKQQITMEDLKNAQIQMSIIRQMYRSKTLFQGEIFEGNENEKKILIRHIEQKRGISIDSTRLLYHYDNRNKTNFHEYIDGVEGIALIVKSKKGFLFGAYYSGKIQPEKVLNEFGLLISISNDTSYVLMEPNPNTKVVRAVIYDPFYAIFGNAELRVKSGEDFVFSNFGIMNSYFKHNNKKLVDFVGEESKEVKFESYQFYQVRLALQE